jgi:hypothetical protein
MARGLAFGGVPPFEKSETKYTVCLVSGNPTPPNATYLPFDEKARMRNEEGVQFIVPEARSVTYSFRIVLNEPVGSICTHQILIIVVRRM